MSELARQLYPYLWLVPTLPLAAAVVTAFLGPRLLRRQSHWPCILCTAAACVVSAFVFSAVLRAPEGNAEDPHSRPQGVDVYYSWIQVGEKDNPVKPGEKEYLVDAGFTLRADALSAVMILMVTFVSTLIAIYSIGYMHGDEGYARFFAEVSLFVFMMTTLVLADNFLLLYLGWEGVGLSSFLLIGFWFTKPSAAAAARKAFLVTRIGDMGFLLGIILLWTRFGHHLNYEAVFDEVRQQNAAGTLDHGILLLACLLLLCGAVGKSAQFPLHVWLPDAMEGPTPVSALIHAATMVTAGVYMVARCTPLFMLAPEAQATIAGLGAFTAIMAACIGLTQNDLKRVLAYSTLSQLGYMFLALGSAVAATESLHVPPGATPAEAEAGTALVSAGVLAGMFHLITHAFFKALLFLAAGSVMHAMGNVIDMRRFGGLRRVLPITHWTFLCGAMALAGVPLLSGFWSKDQILDAAWGAAEKGAHYRPLYFVLWIVGLVTAGLTGFYTFRAYFLTFWGEERIPPEAHSHGAHAGGPHIEDPGPQHHGPTDVGAGAHPAHAPVRHGFESPPIMTVPLMILAVFAVALGFVIGQPTHWFGDYLARMPYLPAVEPEGINWWLTILSSVIALSGIGLAWLMYVRQPELPGRLADAAVGLYQLSLNKFHWDELYDTFILKPLHGVTLFCRIFDSYVIDGLVDLIGHVPRLVGFLFRPVQNGLVQFYALAMVLGVTVFIIALVIK
jgi:NADH-quinone oxidoreductase subunit L